MATDNKNGAESFLQPIISSLGLLVSVTTSLAPFASQSTIGSLFIDKNLSTIGSYLAFIFSGLFIWLCSNILFINIPVGPMRQRGQTYPQPWFYIGQTTLIVLLSILDIIFAWGFLILTKTPTFWSAHIQLLFYILFFIILSSIFTILFTTTKRKYDMVSDKRNVPNKLTDLLVRSGLLANQIQVLNNTPLSFQELQSLGLQNLGIARKIKIKTYAQEPKEIDLIISWDMEEVFNVNAS